MNKIGDKLRFKAMGDITDFHCIAEKYLTDLIIKTNGIVTIREITKYGDYRIKECELNFLYEKNMFSGLVEDTAPSTERDVWISDLGAVKTDDGDSELKLSCPQRPYVLRKGFEFEECWNHCAWFRIKDGIAMCGDKIIGKLVEKGTE